ncbi:MAG TPA: MotA/TolQ/ExbB proton channel family protein [Gemmatimonadaceae bacterium]
MIAAIAVQGGQPVPTTPLELITASNTVTQVVLGFLALLSAISWTIIFAKWMEYRSVRRAGTKFIQEFERARTLEDAARLAARGKPNPFTRLFMRATGFLTDTTPALAATTDRGARLSAAQVEALRQVLDSQTDAERDALGRYLTPLATIGSVSPLIGLLGTVLGVIDSFLGITQSGAGNIGAVAPGVAQALTATALALAVAIPAVFGYNIFANRLNGIDGELEGFGSELIALLVREGRI